MSADAANREEILAELSALRRRVRELEASLDLPPANPKDLLSARLQDQLIENEAFPVTVFDAEGTLLYVSRSGAANLLSTPEELVGLNLSDMFPPQDATRYKERMQKVFQSGMQMAVEDQIDNGQTKRWYWSFLHALKDESGQPFAIQCVSHDVTDRKIKEAASNERFRFESLVSDLASKFVSSAEGLANVTERGLERLGRFLEVDRCLLFWLGEDDTRLDCAHEWHAEGLEAIIEELQGQTLEAFGWYFDQLLEGKAVVVPDVSTLPFEAGAERDQYQQNRVQSIISVPISVDGRVLGALCFDSIRRRRDWSDQLVQRLMLVADLIGNAWKRVRVEMELQEREQLVRAIAESTPHIVLLYDLGNQRVLFVNQRVKDILGYDPEDIQQVGGGIITLMHPDDLRRYETSLRESQENDLQDVEFRVQRADGQWRWFRFSGLIYHRSQAGDANQVILIAQDITESRRHAENIQMHREQLAEVSRLNLLGEMAGGIAHELNQPLYSIINFAKACQNVLAAGDTERIDEARQWLESIVGAAGRAGDIIRRLRSLAKDTDRERKVYDVCALIREAVDLWAFEIQRRNVTISLPSEPCFVKVDGVQVKQVFFNLIHNALDALEEVSESDRTIEIITVADDRWVEVSVVDTGRGLPNDELTIFDAFVTTKPKGLGMGLPVSRTIVEEHGGELNPSRLTRGTAMRLTLPLATVPPIQLSGVQNEF